MCAEEVKADNLNVLEFTSMGFNSGKECFIEWKYDKSLNCSVEIITSTNTGDVNKYYCKKVDSIDINHRVINENLS